MLSAVVLAAVAQAPPSVAFVNARIYTVSGPVIQRGTVVVREGKIVSVGNDAPPAGATVVDCTGKTIIPGIVDTHSHAGEGAGGDGSSPIQPEARIIDAINPRSHSFRRVVAGGITTVNVMPGSGHLMSGQTAYLKIRRDPKTVDDLLIRDADGWIFGGLKMANGTNPIGSAPFPGTRAKSMALVRAKWLVAQEYRKKWDEYQAKRDKGEEAKEPDRDLGLDAMVEALKGRRIVQHHTHRADDIVSVLRMAREFNLKVVLQHVTEGWVVAEEIAKAKVPCSIIVIDAPGGKQEALGLTFANGAELARKGVPVAIHTDDSITDSRLLLRSAALAVRGGLSRELALRSLTLEGAKCLGLEKRVGSLETGKDGDLVILSGDPFSTYTKVLETWVEGVKVFDRKEPKDLLAAVGGFGAGREEGYLCCGE
jgi:imidazolonepropionase-like amidohydrolase